MPEEGFLPSADRARCELDVRGSRRSSTAVDILAPSSSLHWLGGGGCWEGGSPEADPSLRWLLEDFSNTSVRRIAAHHRRKPLGQIVPAYSPGIKCPFMHWPSATPHSQPDTRSRSHGATVNRRTYHGISFQSRCPCSTSHSSPRRRLASQAA